MDEIIVATARRREVIDITDRASAFLRAHAHGRDGVCHVGALHTTVAISVADLDPGTDLDMLDAFDALIPKLKYRHPHNPAHVPDHILSTTIGVSATLPVRKGKLLLGEWQSLVLIEFDGPRERRLACTFMEAAKS